MACRFDFYNHRQGLAQVRQSAQNRVGRFNEWDWHKLNGLLEIELADLTSGVGAYWTSAFSGQVQSKDNQGQPISETVQTKEKEKTMPKLKTHRSGAKRYKVTASGKILRRKAGIGHLLQHKDGSRKRKIFKMCEISGTHYKLISKELPYKKYSR